MDINCSNQFWDKLSCCAPWDYIYSLLRPICLQLCMLLSNYCQQLANAWHKAKGVYIHADALAAHKQCDIAAVDRTTCLSKCLQVTVTCEDNLITPCISNFCRWDLSFHIISSLSLLSLLTDIVKTGHMKSPRRNRRADRECITFISDTLAGRQTFQLDLLSDLYSQLKEPTSVIICLWICVLTLQQM